MFDWNPITPDQLDSRKLELAVVEQLIEYQSQIRELVLTKLGRDVPLESWELTRGTREAPFPERINVIERNLQKLAGTDIAEHMQSTVVWQGGLLDERRLDYNDVNRWFDTINLLYEFILSFKRNDLQTGNWLSSDYIDLQTLGLE